MIHVWRVVPGVGVGVVIGLALFAGEAAAKQAKTTPAPRPNAATKPEAARAAPTYVVVEGSHGEEIAPRQQLTVLCPSTHKALGAGFAGLMRTGPQAGAAAQTGLDDIRSVPDMGGGGWQVEATAPDSVRTHQPWRLIVRVTCLRIPG